MNRAMRRRNPSLPDPRLWDHEPFRSQRWLDALIISLPPESEIERDMDFANGRDVGFTYLSDGSKLLRVGANEARIPSRESVLALMESRS